MKKLATGMTVRILPPDNPPQMCSACHQPWPCAYWRVLKGGKS